MEMVILGVWGDLGRCFAPRLRTLALDLRGHGDSDWNTELRYDVKTLVRDVTSVTTSLSLDQMILVGYSLGGDVALRFAALHPERVLGLVLVDFGPELDPRGVAHILDVLRSTPQYYDSVDEYASLLSERHQLVPAETIKRLAEEALRPSGDKRFQLKRDFEFLAVSDLSGEEVGRCRIREESLWRILSRIQCQTLVIRGAASSVLTRRVAEQMASEVLSNGFLVEIKSAGHMVMIDNPLVLGRAIDDFMLDSLGL